MHANMALKKHLKTFMLAGFLLCWVSVSAHAQAPDTGTFLAKTYSPGKGITMPYRFFVPRKGTIQKTYPLVLWLHGAAGRGSDNIRNITGANEIGSHVWVRDTNQAKHPCFVLAPQCADTSLWVSNDGIEQPPDELDIAVHLVRELVHRYPIDTTRIYVAGQSMGGVAVWEAAARYPELFAAALPLCGMGDKTKAKEIARTPVWAFHGIADSVVPIARSREMVEAVTRAGGKPKFSEYAGVGHDVWRVAFTEPGLLRWVFSQHRPTTTR